MINPMKYVWSQNGMTTTQKIVFLSIADRANKDNICWPSIKRIMLDTSIGNKMTVIKAIKELQLRGLITIYKTSGRVNHYVVNFDVLLSDHMQECTGSGCRSEPGTRCRSEPGTEVYPVPGAEVNRLPGTEGISIDNSSISTTRDRSEPGTEVYQNRDVGDILQNPKNTELFTDQVQKCTPNLKTKDINTEEKRRRLTSSPLADTADGVSDGGDRDVGDILQNPKTGAKVDICPYAKIIELYHKILPGNPKVKELGEMRRKYIKARWVNEIVSRLKKTGRSTTAPERLRYLEDFFNIVAKSDFLTGRNPGKNGPFFANIDFLMNGNRFIDVIEGKYNNRRTE